MPVVRRMGLGTGTFTAMPSAWPPSMQTGRVPIMQPAAIPNALVLETAERERQMLKLSTRFVSYWEVAPVKLVKMWQGLHGVKETASEYQMESRIHVLKINLSVPQITNDSKRFNFSHLQIFPFFLESSYFNLLICTKVALYTLYLTGSGLWSFFESCLHAQNSYLKKTINLMAEKAIEVIRIIPRTHN